MTKGEPMSENAEQPALFLTRYGIMHFQLEQPASLWHPPCSW
jgi:hypothetical protein